MKMSEEEDSQETMEYIYVEGQIWGPYEKTERELDFINLRHEFVVVFDRRGIEMFLWLRLIEHATDCSKLSTTWLW